MEDTRREGAPSPVPAFARIVERELMMCRRYGVGLAVLWIWLEGAGALDRRHGAALRERVLEVAAQRLKGRLRAHDAMARVEENAFGVALFDVRPPVVKAIEARLFEELSAPYRVGEVTVEVMAVTGAAVYPRAGGTAAELLDAARHALRTQLPL